jgi:hypothetical protein
LFTLYPPNPRLLFFQAGYALAGFSFTPLDLERCLASFSKTAGSSSDESVSAWRINFDVNNDDDVNNDNDNADNDDDGGGNTAVSSKEGVAAVVVAAGAAAFAELWPDSISGVEAFRDLGWRASEVSTSRWELCLRGRKVLR